MSNIATNPAPTVRERLVRAAKTENRRWAPTSDPSREQRNTVAAGFAGAGAAVATNPAVRAYDKAVPSAGRKFHDVSLSAEQLRAMRQELSPTTRMPRAEELEGTFRGKKLSPEMVRKSLQNRGSYAPKSNAAVFLRDQAGGTTRGQIAAHELGHARLHTKPRIGKLLRRVGYRAKNPLTGLGVAVSALAPEDSAIGDAAQYAGALGVAPHLIDEGYASIKGYGALKKQISSLATRRAARGDLLRSFGTYAAGAVPLIAAPFIARKVKKALSKKSGS